MAALGSLVWVEDTDDAWIDGEVVEANDDDVKVICQTKTVVAKVNAVYPKDPEFPELGVDDMTKLAYLHEPGVLLNLKARYNANEIYTYTGNILIAVNPFKRLPHLYGNDIMEQYKGSDFGELSPHPFAVADSAYRKMINEGVSQAILVSGESGAGKTESTKMLMQYLAFMGGKDQTEGRSVEQQVLESNPVLEAFGNAKTVKNNNSSFQDIERYKLGEPSTFHYLNQSNCYSLSALDDAKEYLATRKAMDVVGISSEEQDAIFRTVAAILHLGNIEFEKGEESDAAEPKDDKSRFHLKVAAELFMCDEKALEDSLCKRVMVTRGESITKSLDPGSAALSRDALAKIVYSKLFDWLVTKINNSIGQDPSSEYIIGVLDIYGFESFKTNSFEQFCINLTNEKLQQHFNQHVFKMEQEEYTKEEIDWSYIEFIDNQDVLDLIEKKPGGIIALIDEACMFPKSTHDTLAQKLYQTFNGHKRFTKPKLARTDFTICHYAGDVTYQTELFLDKNKDYVVREHQALMNSSDCSFVSSLFPKLRLESSNSSKFSSIGSQFKQQLQSLLETLNTTEPHYIRCVKPNNVLKPEIFENINVLHQLRCGGVLEAIRISCAGYPTRKPFSEFLTRFRILFPEAANKRRCLCRRRYLRMKKAAITTQCGWRVKVARRELRKLKMAAKETGALQETNTKLEKELKELTSILELEKQMRMELEEAKNQEVEELKAALSDMKLQLGETQETKSEEILKLQSALQDMQLEFEELAKDLEMTHDLAAENENLKELVSSLQRKTDESETNYEETGKQSEKQEVPVIDNDVIIKLEAENQQLKALVSSLEEKIDALDRKHDETSSHITEQLKESASSDYEIVSDLAAENERLKALVSSLEKEKEGAHMIKEESSTEDIDNEMTKKLAAENKELFDLVDLLEKKIVETEKKYEEASRLCEERLQKVVDTENKYEEASKLCEERLQQVSDMETEDKILRQQALAHSASRKMSPQMSFTGHPPMENGHHASLAPVPSRRFGTISFRRSRIEGQPHEYVDVLIKFVSQKVGFSHGKPVAAFTIYKCLIHWKVFEAEKTSIFDRMVPVFGSAIENPEDNDHLTYWLTNTSTLLFLLQRSLKNHSTSSASPRLPPQPTSFFGRMTQGFRSPSSGSLSGDVVQQVDAKVPALLFKQQLTAYVETIYGIVQENVKRELEPVLLSCIQGLKDSSNEPSSDDLPAQSSEQNSPAKSSEQNSLAKPSEDKIPPEKLPEGSSPEKPSEEDPHAKISEENTPAKPSADNAPEETWQGIIDLLNRLLGTLQKNYVPLFLAQKIFSQTFQGINVQVFNRICTLCKIDDDKDQNVSPDVISNLKLLITDEDEDSRSFSLDNDSSIPFAADEISNCMQEKEFTNVKAAVELADNPNFHFLKD
ncbi:hypothetical protein DY000_02001761 [Brassica cretica]|uniref:Myosin motor domain-containing protein n=1 Tax=Brassica cretica TaxID=69181 RepID=A0ABQ7CEY5_BRACR|nr:hypothetical protein DY000_02001761 [Brassica cretica]